MSGHNPHGHLSQPNSSWNPLQVPSYIPRQPQLAHMSNERPLVRSPLTWHTPTPPDALYSFISANHKNLELNPLLPSFVRGPPPFGTVDLSIQSARNITTPSPRSLTSSPPEFSHNKQITRSVTPTSITNSNLAPNHGVIQSTASMREKFQNANGNNGELTSTGNLFIRDARQINSELAKLTPTEHIEIASVPCEPVELVKEPVHQQLKTDTAPTSPKRASPARTPSMSNNSAISPRSLSPLPQGLPTTPSPYEATNSHIVTPGIVHLPPKTTIQDNLSFNSALPSPLNATSNEDSIDSNTSKTRRKRKPNKTTRMPNESDETFLPKENDMSSRDLLVNDNSKNEVVDKDDVLVAARGSEKCTESQPELNEKVSEGSQLNKEDTHLLAAEMNPAPEKPLVLSAVQKLSQNLESQPKNTKLNENEPQTVIVNNSTIRIESNSTSKMTTSNVNTDSPKSPKPETPSSLEILTQYLPPKSNSVREDTEQNSPKFLESRKKHSKRKGDLDDIETIDKIAAMIASSTEEVISSESAVENNGVDAQNESTEAQNNNSKISDLADILARPLKESNHTESIEIPKESSFEEVENKLEEMFAGIDDEGPACISEPPIVGSSGDSEVVSDLGFELPLCEKNESSIFEDQPKVPSNNLQKRPHSTKVELSPPKKKRKSSKKLAIQKPSTSSSKYKNGNKTLKHNHKHQLKEKVREEIITDIKYKGPYVQVTRDGSVNVFNAPITEDDIEKQNKAKKIIHNNTNSDRNKIRGLHISTLSMKYDADTTDATWMCVFCKKGPHKMGLGDLFGPYIISTTCEDFELSQKDPKNDEFVSKRTKADMYQKHVDGMPVVPSANANVNLTSGTSTAKKRQKTNDSPNNIKLSQQILQQQTPKEEFDQKDIFLGMLQASETSYEVWMHEDCAIWSSGVYIVGARIVGLEAAVWSSTRYKCCICFSNGATVCCLQRGCAQKAHVPCARTQNWTLAEKDFKTLCEPHSLLVSS